MKKLIGLLFFLTLSPALKQGTESYVQPKDSSRSVAAQPPIKTPATKQLDKVPYQEDESAPQWKKSYAKRFYKMLGTKSLLIKDFQIDVKKSNIKRKGRNTEHVKVSYIREDGNPFSFEALIDQETGSLIQSWNKTRYEFQKPHVLHAKGKLYRE